MGSLAEPTHFLYVYFMGHLVQKQDNFLATVLLEMRLQDAMLDVRITDLRLLIRLWFQKK